MNLLGLMALSLTLSAAPAGSSSTAAWHRLVSILEYLKDDYPGAVESGSEFELNEQRAFAAEAAALASELGPQGARFLAPIQKLQAQIEKQEDPSAVSRQCAELAQTLVLEGGLLRSPTHPPSIERGAELYAVSCAACHAADGSAAVDIAQTMQPPPANFLDPSLMDGVTPYKAFNAVTFGIPGTPMPAFPTLSDDDRWSLAFFVMTLRKPPCDGQPPRTSLEELATSTDPQLAEAHGQDKVSCLRRRPPAPDEERSLLLARQGVSDAISLGEEGKIKEARSALLDAYLQGLEPVEPLLRSRDPARVTRLEQGFNTLRLALERDGHGLRAEGSKLLSLIDEVRKGSSAKQDFWSVFLWSLLILLREGFEATIVIAALFAVLKKMGEEKHNRVVHAGWISALAVGLGLFVLARHMVSGAHREMFEAVMAIAASGMLVYAALWLNARANIRKWMGQIRSQMQGALTRGSVLGLFVISFTAMLRESFETAVFLQGLSIDSPSGVAWGASLGVVGMLGLVVMIRKVGYRLPMKPLFNASTVLLWLMAVVILGKGMHALQEVGVLGLRPIRFVQVELLGLYPDAFSLVPQIALCVAPLLVWALRKRSTVETHPPAINAPEQ